MPILVKKSVFHFVVFLGVFTLLFGYQNCGKVHFDKDTKVACVTGVYDEVGACCTSEAVSTGEGICGGACVWNGDKNISASPLNFSGSGTVTGEVTFTIPDNDEIERVTFNFDDGSGDVVIDGNNQSLVHSFQSNSTRTFNVVAIVKKINESCTHSQTIIVTLNVSDSCLINTTLAGANNGTVYQLLDFNVSMTDCPVSGYSIDWDKDSNGSIDASFSNEVDAQFSYSSPGTYTVRAVTQYQSSYGIGSVVSTKEVVITCPLGSNDNGLGQCICESTSEPVPSTGACPDSCFIPAHTTQTWSVSGLTCQSEIIDAETIGHNQLRTFTDSLAPNTGVASFKCENGIISNLPEAGATCVNTTPPPPSTCTLQIADVELTANSGQTRNVYRRVLSPAACGFSCPYESLRCENGHFVDSSGNIILTGAQYYLNEPACSSPCLASCNIAAGTSRSWSVNGVSCSATTAQATISHNSSQTFNDSDAPNTGTASFQCNNGVLALTPGAGATCIASVTPPPVLTPEIIYSKTYNGSMSTSFSSTDTIYGRILNLTQTSLGCTEADVADPSFLDSTGACSNSANYVRIDTHAYSSGQKHWNWDGSLWRTTNHNSNKIFGHDLFIPSTFKTCVKLNGASPSVCRTTTVQGAEPKVIISKTQNGSHCDLALGCKFDFSTDSIYVRVEGVAPDVFDLSGKANMRGCTAPPSNPTYCDVSNATAAYTSSRYLGLPKEDWTCTDGESCVWSGVRKSGGTYTHKLSETDSNSMIGQFKVCAYNKHSNKLKCEQFKVEGAPLAIGCPSGQALDGSGNCISCNSSSQVIQNGRCYSCGSAHQASMLTGVGTVPPQPNSDGRSLCNQTTGTNPIPQLGAVQGNELGWSWSCPSTSAQSVSCFRPYGCASGYTLVNGACVIPASSGQYHWESRDRVDGPGSGCHLSDDIARARQDVSRGILLERGTVSNPDFIVNESRFPCNSESDGQVITVYQTCGGWQSGLEGYSGYRCERSDKNYGPF